MIDSRRLPALCAIAILAICGYTAASAEERCEGTLCDLYYDHMSSPQPKQPAAQPAQAQPGARTPAPQADAAPPARKPMVAVQGGGLLGLLQGRPQERCSGTLCDLYYGGPPPERPAAAEPAAAAPAPAAQAADAEVEEPVAASRGIEPRESVRRCASKPGDPWGCYR